jgi:uroporphyrinogen decarboxylase
MRQAGRYMAEYRNVREKVGFLELCKTPDLACEVTVTAVEKLGVDAAIIFADILLILEPMGAGLQFTAKDGPVINKPVRVAEDVTALKKVDPESLSFVFEAIRKTRQALPKDIPLIGFCGAPFTLASYLIEGGSSKHFAKTKKFMYDNPKAWHALLDHIVEASIPYLLGQVEAGAQAIQIFDSWVGCLGPDDYDTYVKEHVAKLILALGGIAPVIHFGLASNSLLLQMQAAGGDVIGLDWRVDLAESWSKLEYRCGVQGNLDPTVLLSNRREIEKQARKILAKAANRRGHIFNLGHGVLPETPIDNVRFLVDCVKRLSVR